MVFGEKVTCRSEFRESEKVQRTKHGRRNVFFFHSLLSPSSEGVFLTEKRPCLPKVKERRSSRGECKKDWGTKEKNNNTQLPTRLGERRAVHAKWGNTVAIFSQDQNQGCWKGCFVVVAMRRNVPHIVRESEMCTGMRERERGEPRCPVVDCIATDCHGRFVV